MEFRRVLFRSDADAGNGCEAAPVTFTDGDALVDRIEASIVPTDDGDTFTLDVADGRQLLCDGRLVVTLTAPAGVSLRLELIEGEEVLGRPPALTGCPPPSPSASPSASSTTAQRSRQGSPRSGPTDQQRLTCSSAPAPSDPGCSGLEVAPAQARQAEPAERRRQHTQQDEGQDGYSPRGAGRPGGDTGKAEDTTGPP